MRCEVPKMNHQQKEVLVKELQNDFADSQALFLVGYRGLTVAQMQTLRKGLREKGGSLKVAKVRLMKRAVENVNKVEQLMPYLKGQLALVYSEQEPPVIAKILYNFAKDNEQLDLIAGCLDSELLKKEQVVELAKLPSRDVLLAQILGAIEAPASQLLRAIKAPVSELISVLQQMAKKQD